MTPHGKANHVVVHSYTPPHWGAVRRRTPVERRFYDNLVAMGNGNISGCGRRSQMFQTSAQRCAVRRPVQSTVEMGDRAEQEILRSLGLERELAKAIGHIEHMAAWITKMNSDYHVGTYSFEGLGEDMPGFKAACPMNYPKASKVSPDR